MFRFTAIAAFLLASRAFGAAPIPTLEEVVAAKSDLWAEAALREPGGPTYEFFAKLLPPPRYVNADFKYYPVVLSAPGSPHKARWISNGSGLNLTGGARSWHDIGTPITFRVGTDELRFGDYPQRIDGPQYVDGFLPIAQIKYAHGEAVYAQEAFASGNPALANGGVVLLQFSLASGTNGQVGATIDAKTPLHVGNGAVRDDSGKIIAWFDDQWQWTRGRLVARLRKDSSPSLAVPLQPVEVSVTSPLRDDGYDRERQSCIDTWQKLLAGSMQVKTPEPVVNNAFRSHLIQNLALVKGSRMHYSAGNQYDQLYEAEGCDAVQALLVWGLTNEVRRLIPALLDFTRKGLEYHQAGHKLQLLVHYYWLTRDAEFIQAQQPRWQKELTRILEGRSNEHGLFPREQYCGDVATPVFSLNSNAKCWRALRDFAAVLSSAGQGERAAELAAAAAGFRSDIVRAVEKSERDDIQPPFIPIALFGEEQPPNPITGTKIGSYWNLMANYVLGSEVFGPGSEREDWLLDYVRQLGGLCMGLIRSRPNPTFWTGPHSINPLYGLRRTLTLLRRDEADAALVSFYGMLAQGMTRDTFIGGEGCSLTPLDEGGRLFYCPPNSASNGYFLWMLRCLLIQDCDLNDDGEPETLRLLFATPRQWLEDRKTISVQRAPTAFGNVSVRAISELDRGQVGIEIESPPTPPKKMFVRARLPEGWKPDTATIDAQPIAIGEDGAIDVSGRTGTFKIMLRAKPLVD
jgi:hypothetical protein